MWKRPLAIAALAATSVAAPIKAQSFEQPPEVRAGLESLSRLATISECQQHLLENSRWVMFRDTNLVGWYDPQNDSYGLAEFDPERVQGILRSVYLPAIITHEAAHRYFAHIPEKLQEEFTSTSNMLLRRPNELSQLQEQVVNAIYRRSSRYQEAYGSRFDSLYWSTEVFATWAEAVAAQKIGQEQTAAAPIVYRYMYPDGGSGKNGRVEISELQERQLEEKLQTTLDSLRNTKEYWQLSIMPDELHRFYTNFLDERFFPGSDPCGVQSQ